MEKFYKKHPEARPKPEKPETNEEPEEPKNEPILSYENYEKWDQLRYRITDIIILPPDVPVHENRPNRDNI